MLEALRPRSLKYFAEGKLWRNRFRASILSPYKGYAARVSAETRKLSRGFLPKLAGIKAEEFAGNSISDSKFPRSARASLPTCTRMQVFRWPAGGFWQAPRCKLAPLEGKKPLPSGLSNHTLSCRELERNLTVRQPCDSRTAWLRLRGGLPFNPG